MDLDQAIEKITHLPEVTYGKGVTLPEVTLPDGIYVHPPPHVFGQKKVGDPRLVITHIVNRNFKSYAGEIVLGPFHQRLVFVCALEFFPKFVSIMFYLM